VLLPSDTHRKSVTSVTVVLLPFVICLLTLSRKIVFKGTIAKILIIVVIFRNNIEDGFRPFLNFSLFFSTFLQTPSVHLRTLRDTQVENR
jgi:hypothetical protein